MTNISEPNLNVIGDLYYNELDDLMEVATQEACVKYPKEDWKQIKLLVIQSLVHKSVMMLVNHIQLQEKLEPGKSVDGDKIMTDWIETMMSAFELKGIKSNFVNIVSAIDKEGETLQ